MSLECFEINIIREKESQQQTNKYQLFVFIFGIGRA
jgi:hypothetical protein